MKLLEYQKNTVKTFVKLEYKLDLCHCVMGMVSEIVEIHEAVKDKDFPNVGEEVGDYLWYISNYCRIRGIDSIVFEKHLELSVPSSINEVNFTIKNLYNLTALLTDLVKKYIAYSREIDKQQEIELLTMIVVNLSIILATFNLEWEDCLDKNISKLKSRFGDKFTEDGANNRNLEAERAILEGNQGA